MKQHYDFPSGDKNPRWNGGRYIAKTSGYAFVKHPDHPNADKRGYVREHIWIMSQHLGRPLSKNEVVHHINGVRDDNRTENLVLMLKSLHISYHTKGNVKPSSLNNLKRTGMTSEQAREMWNTTRKHERHKPVICPICNKLFVSRQTRIKYCSRDCFYLSRRKI